ncbi:MAG: DUF4126 family protein [Acidobacteriota bacterium]
MNTTSVLALAFAIGVIAGLRSMTAPAVVSWAACWKWLDLQQSNLAFLGSTAAAYILAAAAIVELVVDKLPQTPSRKAPLGLIARLVLGGLSGAALCTAAHQSVLPVLFGAVLGGLGGVIGAFAGYEARTRLVKTLKAPGFVVALLEDAIAIGGGFFIVSRFQ